MKNYFQFFLILFLLLSALNLNAFGQTLMGKDGKITTTDNSGKLTDTELCNQIKNYPKGPDIKKHLSHAKTRNLDCETETVFKTTLKCSGNQIKYNGECVKIPDNARKLGDTFACNDGYKQEGRICIENKKVSEIKSDEKPLTKEKPEIVKKPVPNLIPDTPVQPSESTGNSNFYIMIFALIVFSVFIYFIFLNRRNIEPTRYETSSDQFENNASTAVDFFNDIKDPFTGMKIDISKEIYSCLCGVYYNLESFRELVSNNNSKCLSCGKKNLSLYVI